MKYVPTIGLEIHIELNTQSKMFCSCKNGEGLPNQNTCPVCLAHPGVLPVINQEAVKKLLKTALALNCEICLLNRFERKNYFYPDLPKGYQISQYSLPMSRNGSLGKVRIERIHLEEDTGKLLHPGGDYSLVDFNRAGVPLMELVTEPDIHSAKEARDFIKELQLVLRYLNTSFADMEKGQMRCEVNISLAKEGDTKLGTKVEIKNLNSIKSVEKSIEQEIERQAGLLEKGEKVVQETRGFNDFKQKTFSQRKKEEAHDYRYFPEPDLPPLRFTEDFLLEVKSTIPELPKAKRERFEKEYGLTSKEIELYISDVDLGNYYEAVVSELKEWTGTKNKEIAKLASNYIASDLQALLKEKKENKIAPENFAEFLSLISKKEISSKIAKMVLLEMFETGKDPSQIIQDRGLKQIGDSTQIESVINEVIQENPKPIQEYKAGKQNSLQFLVGCVMKKTSGRANPEMVQERLKDVLRR